MPACTTCTQSYPFSLGYISATCTTSVSNTNNAENIVYTGPNLPCSGVVANDTLDIILQKMDVLLCASGGDYSLYDTACLAPIANVQEFVESISAYVCNTQSQLTIFTEATFPNYVAATDLILNSIINPGITCSAASVVNTDTLIQVLGKYCTKFGDIDTLLNLSSANWNLCYAVSPIPTTPVEAFNTLIAQICLLKSIVTGIQGSTLPVFNNVGSCLPSPGTADTLVDTVNKIKTRLCQTGTIDTTTLSWGCVTQPVAPQDLQSTLQNIMTLLSNTVKTTPTVFSGDFTVTNVDNGNLCLGKNVALATPSTQDRFVAATASDTSPGTLQAKMVAGTNITLDFLSSPGQVIINSVAGSGGGGLVLADNTDPNPDYLINKVNGGLAQLGISLTPVLDTSDPGNHEVSFQLNVDPIVLFTSLLQVVSTDAGLKQLFCSVVASCPSPCAAPLNVQVTYTPGPTSSTTTTSSTSTTTTTTP